MAKITFLIAQLIPLKVQKLTLHYFKNHADLHLNFKDVVGIAGLNGVGKTTILDALYFLCLGKSYFSATDTQCIQTNQLQTGIIAEILIPQPINLKIKLKRGAKKIIEKNGTPYKKLAEHIGTFSAVVIAPNDIELIYGTNEKRRSFINQIICQIDRNHLQQLISYNKLIEHRNKHLKENSIDITLLNAFDDQISPLAKSIHARRKKFFQEFSTLFQTNYHQISEDKEHIELEYVSQLSSSTYKELTETNHAKDVALRRSNSGIHKDEIDIRLNELNLRKFGSQGQIKSALIALKLAEFDYLRQQNSNLPILLLDDIFEKIDEERAKVLTRIIKNGKFGQIFITDTNINRIESFCKQIGKSYNTLKLN